MHRPPVKDSATPKNLTQRVFKLSTSLRLTPLRIDFTSGIPDPAAGGA